MPEQGASFMPAHGQCGFCLNPELHRHPELCEHCQCWNNLAHMIRCTKRQYVELGLVNLPHDIWFASEQIPTSVDLRQLRARSMEDMVKTLNCRICQTLIDCLRRHKADLKTSSVALLRLWAEERRVRSMDKQQGPWTGKFILTFYTLYSQGNGGELIATEPHLLELQLSYSSAFHGFQDIKMWDRSFVNTTTVKDWLSYCREHHEMCNQGAFSRKLPPGFRVIDVQRRCVEPKNGCEYVALSYLWATATGDKKKQEIKLQGDNWLEEPGCLSADRLPEVIEDAIQFCRDIGIKYLWVDRLCIFQHGDGTEKSKQEQINGMDAIYWLAAVTLVACANGVGVGLPGVSSRPKSSLKNHGWNFDNPASSFKEPGEQIADLSSWNTRGWTFQERWISRRLIFFGYNHTLLTCFYCNNCEESFSQEIGTANPLRRHERNGDPYHPFFTDVRVVKVAKVKTDRPFVLYKRAVNEYTGRSLSWASDILDAFSGVKNFLDEQIASESLFGLPTRYLFPSLLWTRWSPGSADSKGVIPKDIPSWSWASGLGTAAYQFGSHGDLGNLVYFWHPADRTGRDVVEARSWFDQSIETVRDDLSSELELKRFKENTQRCNDKYELFHTDVWETCPHNVPEAIRHRQITDGARAVAANIPHCLVFNTTEAYLRVMINGTITSEARKKRRTRQHESFDIVSDKGVRIGLTCTEVFPKGHKLNSTTGQDLRCHVIVLGAMNMRLTMVPTTDDDRLLFGGREFSLYVMLVDRTEHLSSRLAIGVVSPVLWRTVEPQWRTVFLV
ncbi:heterokaryon incompatibility protein-domain-containing protein [Xylaria curta]|nr:heterokaryon incompatibility protein-domain-containing protein [Xylaria curta]